LSNDLIDTLVDNREDARLRRFDELVGPIAEPAYRLALTVLRSESDAEDAVQEAALKAWRKLDQLKDVASARSWFLSIVANQCRSMRRTRWWSTLRVAEPEDLVPGVGEMAVDGIDLRTALARLGAEDRMALHLHYYEDLPIEQTAAALGVSVAGARSRIFRALKRLRPDLELNEVSL
jgi:RNA polymerase sigma-70 factor (ECF subfamily)